MADSIRSPCTPSTLYKLSLRAYVSTLGSKPQGRPWKLDHLPLAIIADINIRMSKKEEYRDILQEVLSDLETFENLLRYEPVRQKLFICMGTLMGNGKPLATRLQKNFTMRYRRKCEKNLEVHKFGENSTTHTLEDTDMVPEENLNVFSYFTPYVNYVLDDEIFDAKAVDFGLRLGTFLCEGGWVTDSIQVLQCVAAKVCSTPIDVTNIAVCLDCLQRLLQAETVICEFKAAKRTFQEIQKIIKTYSEDKIPPSLLTQIYTRFSVLSFARSEYGNSQKWSMFAIRSLKESMPERIIVDALRQAARVCVVKRDFSRANLLINQAVSRAKKAFGKRHQKYADVVFDYGYLKLNVDSVHESIAAYKEACSIRRSILGNTSFHVGVVHEDLAYACYVKEYSTGRFNSARKHIDKAIDIMEAMLSCNSLMLASAKRVKALIFEEIVLDKISEGREDDEKLLNQAEELHLFALSLAKEEFGEKNVQTAKHYGNLGRLYQSMHRYEEAEKMHLKAIDIKTEVLGPNDYEVALSVGHLASLYNYHMEKYSEAEKLYLLSISINSRIFGKYYSGLEYDYLGLCTVYDKKRETIKYLKFAQILEDWQAMRSEQAAARKSPSIPLCDDSDVEDVKYKFFHMDT
uniref:Amyloid protein-binding protein 2 n=1 Tax=Ceratitis capitata TaxID=7213 RepID=W8B411_CERCA